MQPALVNALDAAQPGFVATQIAAVSSWIDSRLSKRYRVPFAAPYPEQVKTWTASIVTIRLWTRRGFDSADPNMAPVVKDAEDAVTEVKETADGQLSLFDLNEPTDSKSLVTRGGPLAYSESSPYVGSDVRRQAGRTEDRNRRGT